MTSTFLEKSDLQWLKEVHLPKVAMSKYKVAILYGNEDFPQRIELYKKNDVRCKPTVFVFQEEEKGYRQVDEGDK